ncbi:prepilin peptidase CpaA [Ferrimonas sediminum]|uniref:Prepilin peptidase CpaA n=1 Tax=Ferrimonas sediminum TaxID=718193 RepID=A0A1G8YE64_9GAMM|nr:A24 family peptidase [Ferrimonas sediminum]SDK01172.1 prepilin peptidase CpaA [Ferrimonas sediminum]
MIDISLIQSKYILASTVFFIAVITDLKTEKIPNTLVLFGLAAGFVVQTLYSGWMGILYAFGGALTAAIFLLFFYAKRMLGAGDVKLMIAIGTILGPYMVFWNLCFGIIAGGLTTLIFAFYRVGFDGVLISLKRYYQCFITRTYYKPSADEAAGLMVPYAPALAIGWLIIMWAPLRLPGL